MISRALLLLLPLVAQDATREAGRYKLSIGGRESGAEEYRLEEFEDGKTVLFSKAKFDLELPGARRSYVTDTVLTLDKTYAPALYAGYRKAGREEDQVKIEWSKGIATTPKKQVRSSAAFLLDTTVISHLIPVLRRWDRAPKKLKFFNPTALGDFEGSIEDRGEVLLRGKDRAIRAREIQVTCGYVTYMAHLDEKRRMLRAWSAVNNSLAELEGFEGLVPEAIAAEGLDEADVDFPSGALRLAGTLTKPRNAKGLPTLLLISDVGPHDRQGNLLRGKGGTEEFATASALPGMLRAIAQSLSGSGAMVLRTDDRGCGASGGDFATLRIADLVADAAAALAYLRSREDAGPIGLVGHGEGALVACLLAAKDPGVKSLTLLGAPSAPFDEILLARAERELKEQGTKDDVLGQMLGQQKALFERIRKSTDDHLEIDERRTFVGWLRDRFTLDPRAALALTKGPALVVYGTKDREAPSSGAEALRLARPGVEAKLFENLDHFFAGPDGRVDDAALKFLAERVPASVQ